MINSFLNCESSVFAENYRYIMYKYNIPSTLWRRDFKTLILNIKKIICIILKKLPMRTHNYIVCGIVESVNIILDRRIAKYIFNVNVLIIQL